jgi:hypothetical protein
MDNSHLRIVQVSAAKFGVEQLVYKAWKTGFLWWRKELTSSDWEPWGKVFDHKKVMASTRYGTIYGDMVRRYFDSVAAAEAYIEERRKPYPIVVKDPA